MNKLFISFISFLSMMTYADTISFRAHNWCPFNCEPNTKEPGYVVEILEATLGRAGHKIDYQILAWTRAIVEVGDGKFNALIAASADDLKGGKITEPIGLSKNCFYVKNDSKFK